MYRSKVELQEGDDVRGKIFRGLGEIPLFSNFLTTWSRAGSGQVFWVVTGQVWSKIFSWYQVRFCQTFKHQSKRSSIDIRRVVVKLSGSLVMPYGMASLLKNF